MNSSTLVIRPVDQIPSGSSDFEGLRVRASPKIPPIRKRYGPGPGTAPSAVRPLLLRRPERDHPPRLLPQPNPIELVMMYINNIALLNNSLILGIHSQLFLFQKSCITASVIMQTRRRDIFQSLVITNILGCFRAGVFERARSRRIGSKRGIK